MMLSTGQGEPLRRRQMNVTVTRFISSAPSMFASQAVEAVDQVRFHSIARGEVSTWECESYRLVGRQRNNIPVASVHIRGH